MNKRIWIGILLALFFLLPLRIFAQSCPSTDRDPCANYANTDPKKQECYQNVSNDCQNQSNTLTSQINYMNSQIQLTTIRIQVTQAKINTLLDEITQLENEVQRLEEVLNTRLALLLHRIPAAYKRSVAPQFGILLFSRNVSDLIDRAKYLSAVQKEDASLVFQVKATQNSYNESKQIREDKKVQLDQIQVQLKQQTTQLNQEKAGKQKLLDETNGNEATYQNLLAQARAEFEQIQGIIAGRGTETEVGSVGQGDVIATIIQGQSCNSTGTHLHFTVSRNGAAENPFNYLKSVSYTDDSGGDSFTPSGSWDWPIDTPVDFHQGYGDTWYVRTFHAYAFHNGIDISGSSSNVKAVKSGTLFRGSYLGNGGCLLRYMRVHQSDDGLDTFYLHINYTR
jgi:peptidoglycan hydrolase CwlO-like protein